jgi:hypothetical protein
MMPCVIRPGKKDSAESGFALVLSMVVLLVLTLLGIWALNTSTFELKVAGSLQQVERQFNIVEGAANTEAVNVGFVARPFYQIFDPTRTNQILTPDTQITFNPGSDNGADGNVFPYPGPPPAIKEADPATWPWENLLRDHSNPSPNNEFDYRYLTTYLYEEDRAFIGYSASDFSAYKHRIQGSAVIVPSIVELGGVKMGPKSNL